MTTTDSQREPTPERDAAPSTEIAADDVDLAERVLTGAGEGDAEAVTAVVAGILARADDR
jgi:hypothetical protein